ncbi:D site-binding protein isoform X2 [Carettochelys insculpta]|uniref:D site-binding protein isoform X2 n=1 Tax=Carettochelys insculpta TaxID=44489 RepID=UPI003EBADFFB
MARQAAQLPNPLLSSPQLGLPGAGLVNLKSLLQQGPVKSPERRPKDPATCMAKEKERKMEEELGGVRAGQCAYLGSLLWERTLPYSEIEYVDLDEFLLENGLPPSPAQPPFSPASQATPSPASASGMDLSRPASCTSSACSSPAEGLAGSDGDQGCTKADLALSSVPGHETFDPRKHRFSDEELKPQPIMKKARKIQVPDEQKDEKYWNRRYKNNEAAKRSRDARRLKENQITVRAAFLEKENAVLRQEVASIRQELSRYRTILSKGGQSETQLPPLSTRDKWVFSMGVKLFPSGWGSAGAGPAAVSPGRRGIGGRGFIFLQRRKRTYFIQKENLYVRGGLGVCGGVRP